MRTIAISIDEPSLAAIDRLAQAAARGRDAEKAVNRSQLIRQAVQEFVARGRKHERERKDQAIFAANRARIERETKAIVAAQAKH